MGERRVEIKVGEGLDFQARKVQGRAETQKLQELAAQTAVLLAQIDFVFQLRINHGLIFDRGPVDDLCLKMESKSLKSAFNITSSKNALFGVRTSLNWSRPNWMKVSDIVRRV